MLLGRQTNLTKYNKICNAWIGGPRGNQDPGLGAPHAAPSAPLCGVARGIVVAHIQPRNGCVRFGSRAPRFDATAPSDRVHSIAGHVRPYRGRPSEADRQQMRPMSSNASPTPNR